VSEPSSIGELLGQYERGAAQLREAVAGMTPEQLHARPIAGKWSTHEVVCHLADAEMLYADRIKRVIVENQPTLPGLDPDLHAKLAIVERNATEEVELVDLIRKQVLCILRTLRPDDFQRQGIHTEAGPMTIETLLRRVTGHIPHHVRFIAEKRAALGRK
jgi:uncharacterized damage-inducible protein DinB